MIRDLFLSLVLVLSLSGCGSTEPLVTPPPAVPKAPPPAKTQEAPPPPPAEKKAPEKPQDPCVKDLSAESPIVQGEVGEGKRLVRVINKGKVELRVRLLDEQLKPIYPGTLRVLPGEKGEYKVGEGNYNLRFRLQSTCEVRRGSAIRLIGKNFGYEKIIKTRSQGRAGLSKRVDEAL